MSVFHFKQFSLQHDKSSIKIGTDAVLLGAWTPVESARNILDIGCGCGVIGFMLAQRCQAHITGIDIDKDSILDAEYNRILSPWAERISFQQIGLQSFTKEDKWHTYDYIVSNPPYFEHSLQSPYPKRNIGKHNVELNLEELITSVNKLLHSEGKFCCILPADAAKKTENLCQEKGLHISKICHIQAFPHKHPNRTLFCFEKKKTSYNIEYMDIRNNAKEYSDAYRQLTKEYYLNM
ncbi:MAG: methyltransferase domain-containing protein [Bacteroidales bacterium]